MWDAFLLSIGQLTDKRVFSVMVKVTLITIGVFAVGGVALFFFLQFLFPLIGLDQGSWIAALAGVLIAVGAGTLLFRVVAIAVLDIFTDEMVEAVEEKHYPKRAASAGRLGGWKGFKMGLRSAGRALGYNLLALPVHVVLMFTGIGPAIAFFLLNGYLLGRDLQEMVFSRHQHDPDVVNWKLETMPKLWLGIIATFLLMIPFVNFVAPLVSAAMATHLIHRGSLTFEAGPNADAG